MDNVSSPEVWGRILEIRQDFNFASKGHADDRGWLVVFDVPGKAFLVETTVTQEFAKVHDMGILREGDAVLFRGSGGGRVVYNDDGDFFPVLVLESLRPVDQEKEQSFNTPPHS